MNRNEEYKECKEGKAWTADRANDILKTAFESPTLCRNSYGCDGCPFRTCDGKCLFEHNPAVPLSCNIRKETVYTIKIPDA